VADVKLIAGGHDQVSAAIGAGAISDGVCADGMGTVECLAVSYRNAFESCEMGVYGYPNVPHGVSGLYCTYLLNLSCGSLVDWWLTKAFSDVSKENIYTEAEKDFSDEPTGLLVLPYFGGASTPYQNINAKGSILNLKLSDSASRVYQGIFEGLAMEMKLNLDLVAKHGVSPKMIVATGGCSASRRALQIKSDIFGLPVYPLKIKEAGICGCAMLGASALLSEEIGSVAKRFVKLGEPLEPRAEIHQKYKAEYEKYKELYLTLKKFY
jgi:xylulokinase